MSVRRPPSRGSTTDQFPRTAERSNLPAVPRAVWLAFILLFSAMIAAAAGLLTWAAGGNAPTAVLAAGGAYAGSAGLLLAIASFVTDRR
jgi:hypothetical protein